MIELDLIIKALIGGLVIAGIDILNKKAGAKAAAILSFIPIFTFLGVFFVGSEAIDSGENLAGVIHQYLQGLLVAAPIMLVFLFMVYYLIKQFSLLLSVILSLAVWLSLSVITIAIIG